MVPILVAWGAAGELFLKILKLSGLDCRKDHLDRNNFGNGGGDGGGGDDGAVYIVS